MTDLIESQREKIIALQREMAKMPQVSTPTLHHFADGMYAREMHIPAGTVVVGKIHRKEHFFMLVAGVLEVTGDGEPQRLVAPRVLCGKPGTKRAVFARTDCVVVNVHRTELTDIEAIEREVIEPEDDQPLLDAFNRVKEISCLGA